MYLAVLLISVSVCSRLMHIFSTLPSTSKEVPQHIWCTLGELHADVDKHQHNGQACERLHSHSRFDQVSSRVLLQQQSDDRNRLRPRLRSGGRVLGADSVRPHYSGGVCPGYHWQPVEHGGTEPEECQPHDGAHGEVCTCGAVCPGRFWPVHLCLHAAHGQGEHERVVPHARVRRLLRRVQPCHHQHLHPVQYVAHRGHGHQPLPGYMSSSESSYGSGHVPHQDLYCLYIRPVRALHVAAVLAEHGGLLRGSTAKHAHLHYSRRIFQFQLERGYFHGVHLFLREHGHVHTVFISRVLQRQPHPLPQAVGDGRPGESFRYPGEPHSWSTARHSHPCGDCHHVPSPGHSCWSDQVPAGATCLQRRASLLQPVRGRGEHAAGDQLCL